MKKRMSILLALVLLTSCVTVWARAETTEVVCREENFATRIPAGASARYEEGTGLVIYTHSEGKIPYVFVTRRSMDMKFKNPVSYLENVVREYLEDRYGDKFLGMNSATIWNIGGKELLGTRYMYLVGDTTVTLLWLLEIRDGGDVEYAAKYCPRGSFFRWCRRRNHSDRPARRRFRKQPEKRRLPYWMTVSGVIITVKKKGSPRRSRTMP